MEDAVGEREQQEHERQEQQRDVAGVVGRRMRIDEVVQQAAHDEDVGVGNHRIERVLEERLQPVPEQPLHLRHDEEWNEHRADQHDNGSRDIAEGDDRER